MRTLRNHILLQFAVPFFLCLFLLLFAFMIGRGLVQMADLIFNKDVDVLLMLKLMAYSLPFLMTFVIPMAVLVATLLAFGKLSFDNEIMAMRASGLSMFKVVKPLFVCVALICLLSFILSDRIAPASHYAHRRLVKQIGMESPGAVLEEGTFIKKFKKFIIFIYEIDKNFLKGIRIYQPQEGKPTRTIIAESGELISIPEKNIVKLRLRHGTSDEPDPKDLSKFYKLNFKTYDLPLTIPSGEQLQKLGKKPKDMTIKEIREEINDLNEKGIDQVDPLFAEIHKKIALSFASLAFFLIGIPLGVTTRRTDKSISFAISLVLFTAYWTLLISGKALAEKGLMHPFLALQGANFLVGSLGIFLFWRSTKA